MDITLNNETFYVNNDEFPLLYHEAYTTLKIHQHLNIIEREIGLIQNIMEIYNTPITFVDINTTHGGYLPIKLLPYAQEIIIISNDSTHNTNITKNRDKYDIYHKIKIIDNIMLTNNNLKIFKFENDYYDYGNVDGIIILTKYNPILINHKCYNLSKSDLNIYIPNNLTNIFENNFKYYLTPNSNILDYNNLIHVCMMVKDASDNFKNILEENLQYIDEWTILDTGSTDNTINIINDTLKNKKGNLYQELFINFRESRNRCLELAKLKQHCKFLIMLDDTYILKGNVREFLELLRGDQFADSYNVYINSKEITYGSNRLLRADRDLKYINKIHEIIQSDNNIVVQCPHHEINIDDISSEYMHTRTISRKQKDLNELQETLDNDPDNPRTLFYFAQTYCELEMWDKAYEYAEKRVNHPNKGYSEEITESYLIMANIIESVYKLNFNECIKAYKKCYEHDKLKADSLYCIGLIYNSINNTNKAYKYFKKAFELGFPVNSTSNLRPSLYNKLIPEMLISLCYLNNDCVLGEQACQKYLELNEPTETIASYLSLFSLLIKDKEIKETKPIKKSCNKNILCFVAEGGFNKWSGNSINTKGVGGSETYIIEMSKYIAKLTNYKVYVFCNTDNDEIYENVKYKNLSKYVEFINKHKIHTCFISRFSEYIPVTIKNDVDNIYLVLHDLTPSGNIIPIDNKLKGIFCMSDWHKEYFIDIYPSLKDITFTFPNGIDTKKFPKSTQPKIKNSFIYSSFPNRGLINLLKMFPKIRERLNDATLNIFCDMDNSWVNRIAKDEIDQIKELLEIHKEYVTNHGFIRKEILYSYMCQSEIWLYPCTFQETFCITNIEAKMCNVICITNNLGALNELNKDGIIIPGDPNSDEWQNMAIDECVRVLSNVNRKRYLLDKNIKFAINYDWEILIKKMVDTYIGNHKNIGISNKISISNTPNYENMEISKKIPILNTPNYENIEILKKTPNYENIKYICDRFSHCKNVLEIGYKNPTLPIAIHFIDISIIDITKDKLPFKDNEFDLVYCYDSFDNMDFVIKEFLRVGRILCLFPPSPFVELIENNNNTNIVWVNKNNKLNIIPKLQGIKIPNIENYKKILENKYFWNTYFIWDKIRGPLSINIFYYDENYEKNINTSLVESYESIQDYVEIVELTKQPLEYSGMLNWSSDIPNGSKNIFQNVLDIFKNKSCSILEIGTFTGTSVINMLKYLPDAKATVIDSWKDYDENKMLMEITKNKIEDTYVNNLLIGNVTNRIVSVKGDSKDVLVKFLSNNFKYDFIYVDGSHKCLDCYGDMIMAWNLLVKGGVMGIDDYLWQPEICNSMLDYPKMAVDFFMERYKNEYKILDIGYRVFLLKL